MRAVADELGHSLDQCRIHARPPIRASIHASTYSATALRRLTFAAHLRASANANRNRGAVCPATLGLETCALAPETIANATPTGEPYTAAVDAGWGTRSDSH